MIAEDMAAITIIAVVVIVVVVIFGAYSCKEETSVVVDVPTDQQVDDAVTKAVEEMRQEYGDSVKSETVEKQPEVVTVEVAKPIAQPKMRDTKELGTLKTMRRMEKLGWVSQ